MVSQDTSREDIKGKSRVSLGGGVSFIIVAKQVFAGNVIMNNESFYALQEVLSTFSDVLTFLPQLFISCLQFHLMYGVTKLENIHQVV